MPKKQKLNRLTLSVMAVTAGLLLSACGGGDAGGAGYTPASSSISSSVKPVNGKITSKNTTERVTGYAGQNKEDSNIDKAPTSDDTSKSKLATKDDTSLSNSAANDYVYSNSAISGSNNQISNTNNYANATAQSAANAAFKAYSKDAVNIFQQNRSVHSSNLQDPDSLQVLVGNNQANSPWSLVEGVNQVTYGNVKSKTQLSKNTELYSDPKPGKKSFTGNNTVVGIIDGYMNPEWKGFNVKPTALNTSNLDEKNKQEGKTQDQFLGKDNGHANYVAEIFNGKFDRTAGVTMAQAKQVVYWQIPNGNNNFFEVFQEMYDKHKPFVVNNSWSFNEKYTDAKAKVEGQSGKQKPAADADNSALVKLLPQITSKEDAPLYVWATSNIDDEARKKWYQANAAETKKHINDYNWAIGLDNDSILGKLTSQTSTADNIITVTGVLFDLDRKALGEEFKLRAQAVGQSNAQSATSVSQFTKDGMMNYKEAVTISTGAMACGVTKYSCIAGFYNTYFQGVSPITNRTERDIKGQNGTSFSAPQVTAAAALLHEQFPWMTAKQVKTTLLTTAIDLGDEGVDDTFGWGLLHLPSALNGPGAFAFGDFYAKLDRNSTEGKRYYFNNDIHGAGKLIVSGKENDYLYLTGSNKYTGDTIVESGNLVLASSSVLFKDSQKWNARATSPTSAILVDAALTSNVYVNHNGHFYMNMGITKDITNNGYLNLRGGKIEGNLVQKADGILEMDISDDDWRYVEVTGNADLDGYLSLVNKGYTSKEGYGKILLTTKNGTITTKFKGLVSGTNRLTNVDIYNQTAEKRLVFISKGNTADVATRSMTSLSSAEERTLATGVSVIDAVLTQAEVAYQERKQQTQASLNPETASVDSIVSTPDYELIDGVKVYTGSNPVSLSGSTGPSLAEKTAADLQNLSDVELNKIIYAASGTAYQNLQLAATNSSRQQMQDFTQVASAANFQSADRSLRAYFNFNGGWTNWDHQDTSAKGKLTGTGYALGAYTKYDFSPEYDFNFGLSFAHNHQNWDENLYGAQYQTLNTNLAHGTSDSNGVTAVFGFAGKESVHTFVVDFTSYDYEVKRSLFTYDDVTGEFTANAITLGYDFNHKLYQGDQLRLDVNLGVFGRYYRQGELREVANSTKATGLRFTSKQRGDFSVGGYAGLELGYLTKFGTTQVDWFAGAKVTGLSNNKFNLDIKRIGDANAPADLQTGENFEQNFLAELRLGAKVQISESFAVQLSGSYKKANQYDDKNLSLTATLAY